MNENCADAEEATREIAKQPARKGRRSAIAAKQRAGIGIKVIVDYGTVCNENRG